MPLVLQLHLVMMNIPTLLLKTLLLFEKWTTLNFLHNNNDDLVITIAQLFLQKRQAKNAYQSKNAGVLQEYHQQNSVYQTIFLSMGNHSL